MVTEENKVEKKHEWTEWGDVNTVFYLPISQVFINVTLEWRTDNEKRVQVRMKDEPQLRSRSSCYKDDEFDIYDGFRIAEYRLYVKWVTKVVNRYIKSL